MLRQYVSETNEDNTKTKNRISALKQELESLDHTSTQYKPFLQSPSVLISSRSQDSPNKVFWEAWRNVFTMNRLLGEWSGVFLDRKTRWSLHLLRNSNSKQLLVIIPTHNKNKILFIQRTPWKKNQKSWQDLRKDWILSLLISRIRI